MASARHGELISRDAPSAPFATTGQEKYRKPFAPLMPGVEFVRFNDVADLKKKFDSFSLRNSFWRSSKAKAAFKPVTHEFLKTRAN